MIIKKESLIQYSLLWIAFIFHDSLLIRNNYIVIAVLSVCFLIYVAIRNKKVLDIKILILLVFLLLNIFLIRYRNNGGVGLEVYSQWFICIMSIMFAYRYNENEFFTRFINLIILYCSISLFCSAFYMILPEIYKAVTPLHSFNIGRGIVCSGFQLVHIVSSETYVSYRNTSIFTEPGLYQIPLNSALYFLVICRDRLHYSKKKYNKYLFILLVTIISARSTTGYMGALAILAAGTILSDRSTKKKAWIVAGISACFCAFDLLLNGENGFIYANIIYKITNIENTSSSFFYRLETQRYVLDYLATNLFGGGIDGFIGYVKSDNPWADIAGNAFFIAIGYYGIQIILVYVFMMWNGFKNRQSLLQFLLICFLYVNTTIAQSNIFYPSVFVLFFIDNTRIENVERKARYIDGNRI